MKVTTIKRLDVTVPKNIDFYLLIGFFSTVAAPRSSTPTQLLVTPSDIQEAIDTVHLLDDPHPLHDFLVDVDEAIVTQGADEVLFRKGAV